MVEFLYISLGFLSMIVYEVYILYGVYGILFAMPGF